MSKQGSTYYDGPYGNIVAITPAERRGTINAPVWVLDPLGSTTDLWPGDRFLAYRDGMECHIWNGERWS